MLTELKDLLVLSVNIALISNMVFAKFLGLCPFIGVSRKTSSAVGMGMAVIFVMAMASAATWLVHAYLLLPGDGNLIASLFHSEFVREHGLVNVLRTTSYILVIAVLVQFVEMVMKKNAAGLYRVLGIYLPLITTNCCVLGIALLNTTDAPEKLTLLQATVQGAAGGVGFMIAMLLMSAIRESLETVNVPKPMRDFPIALVCTGLIAMAFNAFAGMA